MEGIRARLGGMECTLSNLSTTGAGVRARSEMALGREVPLKLEVEPKAITVSVKVARCEPVDVALPGAAVWRQPGYAIGLSFISPSAEVEDVVRQLTRGAAGIEQSSPRVLVLGDDDEISKLIEKTLAEADYVPRVLTHPRYAVSTARRIGARAVVVNLRIDPEFSARSILENLRASAATASLPVIVCARQAWLQQAHRTYLNEHRLRLLLVPFTPEELVMTLDRVIQEAS